MRKRRVVMGHTWLASSVCGWKQGGWVQAAQGERYGSRGEAMRTDLQHADDQHDVGKGDRNQGHSGHEQHPAQHVSSGRELRRKYQEYAQASLAKIPAYDDVHKPM